MLKLITPLAVVSLLLLSDTVMQQHLSNTSKERLMKRLNDAGLKAESLHCAEHRSSFFTLWKGGDGVCEIRVAPQETTRTFRRLGFSETDIRVGGPWRERADSIGRCWNQLYNPGDPPSLACRKSELQANLCEGPVFYRESDGKVCVPHDSMEARRSAG